jgi:hypothetical protein
MTLSQLTTISLTLAFAAITFAQDAPPSPVDNCFAVSVLPAAASEVRVQYIHLRSDCPAPDAVQVFLARPVADDRLEAVVNGFAWLPVAADALAQPVRFTGLTEGTYRVLVLPSTGTATFQADPLLRLPGAYAGKYFEFPFFVAGGTAPDSLPTADAGVLAGRRLTFGIHLAGHPATAVLYQMTDTAVQGVRLDVNSDADPISVDLPDGFSPDAEIFVHLVHRDTGISTDYRVTQSPTSH